MEDKVYVCSWSRTSNGYQLWVKSRPRIRASAPTYAEAEARLIDAIQDAGGAMQAVFEFDRPLPKSELDKKYGSPEIYLICGDECLGTDAPLSTAFESAAGLEKRLRWLDEYYDRPVCRKCTYASGRRTDKPITLNAISSNYDGAFGSFGHEGYSPNHQVVSEDFLSLLTRSEKRRLEFQPTIHRGRRKFFELVGPEGPPFVAVSRLPITGWRCAKCDHRTWGHWIDGMEINSFVAHRDLPNRVHGVFTIGAFPEIELAVTASRWKEIVGQKGTRGFTSHQLGVVPDHEVVRRPELLTREQQTRRRRKRN